MKGHWDALSLYQRFESLVAIMLTGLIAVVSLVALYRLSVSVLLGLARKFILIDLASTSAGQLLGLAAMAVALGVVYWFMGGRADRAAARDEAERDAV